MYIIFIYLYIKFIYKIHIKFYIFLQRCNASCVCLWVWVCHLGNKFARLDSLDIICEANGAYNGWIQGLELLVTCSQWLHLYPPRYEDSDPTML